MWIKAETNNQDGPFINLSQAQLIYIEKTGVFTSSEWSVRASFSAVTIYEVKRCNSKEEAEAMLGAIMAQLNVLRLTER